MGILSYNMRNTLLKSGTFLLGHPVYKLSSQKEHNHSMVFREIIGCILCKSYKHTVDKMKSFERWYMQLPLEFNGLGWYLPNQQFLKISIRMGTEIKITKNIIYSIV
jgi:hypothetical protein